MGSESLTSVSGGDVRRQAQPPANPGCKLGVLGEGFSPDAKLSKGHGWGAAARWLALPFEGPTSAPWDEKGWEFLGEQA